MNEVSFKKYQEDLVTFIQKHNNVDYKVEVSAFLNNGYHKEYLFEDGSTFFEVNQIITEEQEVEAHNIKTKVLVKYFVTEYWSTDDATTKYVYQNHK